MFYTFWSSVFSFIVLHGFVSFIPLKLFTMSQQLVHFLLLVLSLFLFLLFIKSNGTVSGTNTSYCPSYNCNGVKTGYLFWRRNSMTASHQYCGYPDFGVNCSFTGGHPLFHLHEDTYYIKNISYSNHSRTLVNIDVANPKCPRESHNITLGNSTLSYSTSSDLNLNFHFNCTNIPPNITAFHIPCLQSCSSQSYVTTDIGADQLEEFEWFEHCDEEVVATVIRNNDLQNVLRRFAYAEDYIHSPTTDCAICDESKGRCVYMAQSNKTSSFCSDRNYDCKGSLETIYPVSGYRANRRYSNGRIVRWLHVLLLP